MEKTISIDGLNIYYRIAGQGNPFLILHGWGASSDSWKGVQEFLSKQGFKTIALDLPGFGKSADPHEAWSVNDYSLFVLKFADKLSLSNFELLGHSFGGRISIKLAAFHQERIKNLI